MVGLHCDLYLQRESGYLEFQGAYSHLKPGHLERMKAKLPRFVLPPGFVDPLWVWPSGSFAIWRYSPLGVVN